MPAHATKASYITSYMKIEVFDRAEKDLIVFGKMNGGGDGSRYCLRAYVNAMCWLVSSEGLTMENWTGVGDFISTLDPSYCVYPILFFDLLFFPFFLFLFPNSNRWKFSSSLDQPPPSRSSPLLFTSRVILATFYTTTKTIHSSQSFDSPLRVFFESRTIDDRLIINNGW